jgi:hypothetical protein
MRGRGKPLSRGNQIKAKESLKTALQCGQDTAKLEVVGWGVETVGEWMFSGWRV